MSINTVLALNAFSSGFSLCGALYQMALANYWLSISLFSLALLNLTLCITPIEKE